jgi:uncharacterized damage-inducible protein DinB
MTEDTMPTNKAEALAAIEAGRRALMAKLGALDEATLSRPGKDGWAIKDHVAHLAAWERYLAALLSGGDRWTEMGLTDAPGPREEAEINAAIYEHSKDLSVGQVYAAWDAAHQQVLDVLAGMTDADLALPFRHFVPEADGENGGDPIYGWVAGNTYGHYAEHAQWIDEALKANE